MEKVIVQIKFLPHLLVLKPRIKLMQTLSVVGDETYRRTSSTSPLRINFVHICRITSKKSRTIVKSFKNAGNMTFSEAGDPHVMKTRYYHAHAITTVICSSRRIAVGLFRYLKY
jgi:hypothetical protein